MRGREKGTKKKESNDNVVLFNWILCCCWLLLLEWVLDFWLIQFQIYISAACVFSGGGNDDDIGGGGDGRGVWFENTQMYNFTRNHSNHYGGALALLHIAIANLDSNSFAIQ